MTLKSPFASHGGALDAARRLYPDAPEPWIDLSTGINPHAYPIDGIAPEAWTHLPAAQALAALEATAARCIRCHSHADVAAAPGTQAIIQQLPALLAGHDMRVLGPAYSEYSRIYAAAGTPVRTVTRLNDLAGADVAIVVNPNNPDGRLVNPADLIALAARVGTLVVDEAFMDTLDPAFSVVPVLPSRGLIVLRSFGKFYGLAGLRLGFAVSTPDVARTIREKLGPWAVSGPALAIGTRALADGSWQQAARVRLAKDAARLDTLLEAAGLRLIGGTSLFRLARYDDARALFEALARAGILTRPFASEATWLRFGLPGVEGAWDRLERALLEFRLRAYSRKVE